MTFTEEFAAAFPARNPLPIRLRDALELLETHHCVRTYGNGERYLTLHSEPEHSDIAVTTFQLPDATVTAQWTNSADDEVNLRLCLFLRTGGDGSYAGLWLDDAGQQRVVHLGSGSGSVMLSVLTENVEDLLRLLAIGYNELCWPEQFELTPEEVRDREYDGDDYPPPPSLLRAYVENTLGLSVPARAAAVVVSTVSMDATESDDPFWNWLKRVRGE